MKTLIVRNKKVNVKTCDFIIVKPRFNGLTRILKRTFINGKLTKYSVIGVKKQ